MGRGLNGNHHPSKTKIGANIIAEAARTLQNARPERKTPRIPGVLDKIEISGAIVDAVPAIASATGVLVQHDYTAQRERVDKRRQPGQRYRNERFDFRFSWSCGFRTVVSEGRQ